MFTQTNTPSQLRICTISDQIYLEESVAADFKQPKQFDADGAELSHCEYSISDHPTTNPPLHLSALKRREEAPIKQKYTLLNSHFTSLGPQAQILQKAFDQNVSKDEQQVDSRPQNSESEQVNNNERCATSEPEIKQVADLSKQSQNAISLLRSEEVLASIQTLKTFAKFKEQELQKKLESEQEHISSEESENSNNTIINQEPEYQAEASMQSQLPQSQDPQCAREQRSCKKERKNYSQVHKGIPNNQGNRLQTTNTIFVEVKRYLGSQEAADTEFNHQSPKPQNEQQTQTRVFRKGYEEIRKIFQNITSFDWDLKDIKNLKQSPESLLTPIVFWFWINSQYFPFDAQMTAEKDFETLFQQGILNQDGLSPICNQTYEEDNDAEMMEEPSIVLKLQIEENFNRFKDYLTSAECESSNLEDLLFTLKHKLTLVTDQNVSEAKYMHQTFQSAYQNLSETNIDSEPHNAQTMLKTSGEFLRRIDQRYVADIKANYEWYMQNGSEVLLNINYPSRTEKEFLRQLELWQQEKNDVNYKVILMQLQHSQDVKLTEDSRYQQMSAHKRGLVVQEDAQCAICNNGDYEDEDLIVFCGMCNIPVHQKCYGIDVVPENDWICNNCSCLALRRGLQVRCILCSKRGGAMKPTSVFSSYEHYQRYHTAAAKKKGLNSTTFLQIQKQESAQSTTKLSKAQLFEREDKNHALSQILTRECNFQDALILQKRQAGEKFPQELVELHFLETEALSESPEDYDFFLQRNQKVFESGVVPPTETLYEWVHLSCAMWIPGPIVTPKTPVRLNKIDYKRFNLQCIICGQKNEGACIQCQHSKCMISFHIECARRANYFMEIDRIERDRCYRIFCEKHRPLKIVKEQEERDRQAVEEVHKFARVIEKSLEINERVQTKLNRLKRQTPFCKQPLKSAPQNQQRSSHYYILQQKRQEKLNQAKEKAVQKQRLLDQKQQSKVLKEMQTKERERLRKEQKDSQRSQMKKWREKDKICLLERIKTRYLQLMKLRMNLVVVDPFSKQLKLEERNLKRQHSILLAEERKRIKKQQSKQNQTLQQQPIIERDGLRKRTSSQAQLLQSDASEVGKLLEQDMIVLNQIAVTPKEPQESIKRVYFKFGNPIYLQELDWAITLSKYEFPWHDIADGTFFSAKECYEKYISLVRDPHTFLKKVLNAGGVIREKYQKLMQNQLNQPPRLLISEPVVVDEIFCVCKGANQSGFFVACEAENDCPYGGWLHPECTQDLVNLPRDIIDNMGVWYCFACTERMKEEEISENHQEPPQDEFMQSDSGDSDDLRQLEAEVEAGKLAIKDLEEDIENCKDDFENSERDLISSLSRHSSDSEEQKYFA